MREATFESRRPQDENPSCSDDGPRGVPARVIGPDDGWQALTGDLVLQVCKSQKSIIIVVIIIIIIIIISSSSSSTHGGDN